MLKRSMEQIYYDINNRNCNNCKYYSCKEGRQPDGMLWEIEDCAIYSNVVPELIDREGCNRWEKQDERRIWKRVKRKWNEHPQK